METRTAWSACLLALLFTLALADVPETVEDLQKSADDKGRTAAQSNEETEYSILISQPGYGPSVQPGYTIQPGYSPSLQPGYRPSVQPGYQQQPETEYIVEYMLDQQPNQQHYVQPSYVPTVQPNYVPSAQPSYVPTQQGYNVHSISESEAIQELLHELHEEASHHTEYHQQVPLVQPSYIPSVQPNYVRSEQPNYVPSIQPSYVKSSYVPSVQPQVTEPDLIIEIIEPQPSVQPGYGPLISPNYQPHYVPSGQQGYISPVTESELIHELEEQFHKQYEYDVHPHFGPSPGYLPVQPHYVPSVQPGYNHHPIAVSELELLHEFQEQQPLHIHVPPSKQPNVVPLMQPAPVHPSYVTTVQPEIYTPPHYNFLPEKKIYSRLIPVHEYILPHKQPGAEHSVLCQREGELHNFWSPNHECLVCTCVREAYGLEPVCVSCSGCALPPPPPPAPEPIIIPIVPVPQPEPIIPVPVPTPVPDLIPEVVTVTCSPMPSGVPFQNPLNPCQVCICYESLSIHGQPDVKIECQENPQCVVPEVQPVPTPVPPTPYPVPTPVPTPQPEINIIPEPIWPPAPGPTPAPIGPLPGPPPHESCRPYSPNQPFQHPWDECQVCICTEAYNVGRISIEVNCFTKKSCCIELPFESTSITTIQPLPVPSPNISPYGPLYPHYVPQEPEVVPIPIPNRIQPYPVPHGPIPHITPGQFIPGSYTPGQVVPGQYNPGHLVPGEYIPGHLVPGYPEISPGPFNPGHYIPGQYTPGHLIPGEVIPGHVTPGQIVPGQLIPGEVHIPGQVIPGSYPYSSNYGGSGSWSVKSETEYQEKDIETSSSTSTGFNQLPGNQQGPNYHPIWKGLPSPKGILGLNGLNLNQRPSHMYTNYGYDVHPSSGSYSPSYVVDEVYNGQPLVSGQQGLISGQQGLISGQPGLMSGQQGLISGQQGLISGQQGLISGPPLISSQGLLSSGPSYNTGYNPLISSQGFTTVKKFKTKSGEPDSRSSEERK